MSRWIAAAPLLVLVALAVLFATFGLHHDPHVTPAALVGKPLPPRALPSLDGDPPRPLPSLVKGPTIVNAFASWCAPCAVENPALLALQAEGARIIGVAYEDDPKNTRAFLDRLGNPFSVVLVDQDGRAGVDLGISGVPETFLVNGRGVVIAKHVGPLTPGDADALMEKAAAATR